MSQASHATTPRPLGAPFIRMTPFQRFVVVFVHLAVFAMVAVISVTEGTPVGERILGVLALHTALLIGPLIWFRPSWGWLHPLVFPAVFGLVGSFRTFPVYAYGLRFHDALPEMTRTRLNELVVEHLLLECLGLTCMYLGYAFAKRLWVPGFRTQMTANLPRRALGLVAFGVVAFLAYMQLRGGWRAHFMDIGQGRHTLRGEFYLVLLATAPGYVATVIWVAYDDKALRRPLFWVVAAIGLAVTFITTGSRGSVVIPLLTWLVIEGMRRQTIRLGRIALLFLVALYLVAVLGAIRRGTWRREVSSDPAGEMSFAEAGQVAVEELIARSGRRHGGIAILGRVPERVDLLYGSTYLAVVTLPIPRSLWEGKPGLVGGRVGRTYFRSRGGVPPGGVGEAYWNFHIFGVIVVYFLFGVYRRGVASFAQKNWNEPLSYLLLPMLLLGSKEPATNALSVLLQRLGSVLLVLVLVFKVRFVRPDEADE